MEQNKSLIIIGAGPAGIAGALEAQENDLNVSVFEGDSQVGGIAKTAKYKGFYFDIGGHRFFSKNVKINRWWQDMLGGDFLEVKRLSRIYFNGKFFYYPLRPINALLNVGFFESALIILSYIKAKFAPLAPEDNFERWIVNRFGRRLFRMFFKSYTEKVWGIPCEKISAQWAAQRIKGLSLAEVIKKALFSGGSKNSPKTLIEKFRYPAYGPGMMWERAARKIMKQGGEIFLASSVEKIFWEGDAVKKIAVKKTNGERIEKKADYFLSTMTLRHLVASLEPAPPDYVLRAAGCLHYRDFLTVVLIINKENVFPDNWIYIHDPEVKVGRIQNFKNWSEKMVPDKKMTCLGMEYFVFEKDGIWSSSDENLVNLAKEEIVKLKMCRMQDVQEGLVIRQKKAYPVYDGTYQENLDIIREYLKKFNNLQQAGRNGLHKYNNMDHSMLTAQLAVRNFLGEKNDVWNINSDSEYLEGRTN